MQSLRIFGYQRFCSSRFRGLLEEAALLQLAVPCFGSCPRAARTAGRGGGRAVPCGADEEQLTVLAAAGTELSPQVSTSYQSLLKVTHRRSLGISRTVVLENCLPACQHWNLDLGVVILGAGSPSETIFDKKLSSLSWRTEWRSSQSRGALLKQGMCREQGFPEPAPGEPHSSKPQAVSKRDVGKKMKKKSEPAISGSCDCCC